MAALPVYAKNGKEVGTYEIEAADVAEEVDQPEQLAPLVAHEVEVLEVDVQNSNVVADVGVVGVLGVGRWEGIDIE